MATENLIKAVQNYEDYIRIKGADDKAIECYVMAIRTAYAENDTPYARRLSARGKQIINDFCRKQTTQDIFTLERYALENGESYKLLDFFYDILLIEAQNHILDSYLLYLERHRPFNDRFYLPRRKCFIKIGLIQALQDMVDDKLDILSISLPPGTGKAAPLYSKILTPNGFTTMGEVKLGDEVIAGNGHSAKIIGIYPQGIKPVYEITLRNGAKCRCSDQHLWTVYTSKGDFKTLELKDIIANGIENYCIPVREHNRMEYWDIKSVEYIADEECQCIMIDDPCHLYITDDYIITHNTTLEKFFHSAICGWFPQRFNLFFSHSADITRMYYDGVLSILQDKEYAWREIFPKCKVTSTNAKMGTININKYKPFQNVMTASVGSEMAGKVRCDGYLLVDDMIGKIEEALNKNTLDKLWGIYSTDARQRKYDGCKEIHIATRWSVHDIIGRLQRAYEGNDRCRFIAVPDIDPKTDESNFLFDVNPLTKRFFDDQAMIMDDVTYRCLYKNDPIEREGQLYPEDSLRRYLSLPTVEPDAIVSVCDTKTTGTDFMVMPAMYKYGDDYYMEDCICDDDSDFGIQEGRLSKFIVEHNMQQCEFESNAGGSRIAVNIDAKVKEMGGRCNITTKPTETNKETRIIVNADWVKKHVLFKDKTLYSPKSDYGRFMNFLTGYTTSGKNPHDDVPDCLANFALNQTKFTRKASFEPIMNPFRSARYYK